MRHDVKFSVNGKNLEFSSIKEPGKVIYNIIEKPRTGSYIYSWSHHGIPDNKLITIY